MRFPAFYWTLRERFPDGVYDVIVAEYRRHQGLGMGCYAKEREFLSSALQISALYYQKSIAKSGMTDTDSREICFEGPEDIIHKFQDVKIWTYLNVLVMLLFKPSSVITVKDFEALVSTTRQRTILTYHTKHINSVYFINVMEDQEVKMTHL